MVEPMTPAEWQRQYMQEPVIERDWRLRDALPCAFCGSLHLEISRMSNYVHCLRCGADGPELLLDRPASGDDRWRISVANWNRRSASITKGNEK